MVIVCQTCGDWGFSVALIYCDNCQDYAVHRYCLDKLPTTFEDHVVWFCVDCEPKVAESSTPKQSLSATNFQLRLKKGSPIRKSKCKNDIKILKNKKRKYDSDSLVISKVQRKSSPLLIPPENHENDDMHGFGSDKEVRYVEAKAKAPSNTHTALNGSCLVDINEGAESSLVAVDGDSTIIEHTNFFDPRQTGLDRVYVDEVVECVKTKASLMATSDQSCLSAQPIFEPIWRGIFRLFDENFDVGVVAHLSSLACLKVCETAKCFPELLCLELLPRCDLWPKGFQKLGPNEESIALYFFPNNARDGSIFYSLVYEMIRQDLGMRVVLQDVELLVFTSKTLPLRFWRFQGKLYLWGVFRAKQASHSTTVVHGKEKSLWDSQSLDIPLSDTVVKDIKSTLPDTDSAEEYMKFGEELSQIVEKSLATTLVDTLTNMRYNGSRTMHEHVNEMTDVATRLNSLGMHVDDDFLVHFLMNSLPPEYNSFRLNYNPMMGKINVNELRNMLTQEETRLKNMKSRSVHFVNSQEVGKRARRRPRTRSRKSKRSLEMNKRWSQCHKKLKNDKCYFCGKSGHFQRDCLEHKAWSMKKDEPNVVFSKSN